MYDWFIQHCRSIVKACQSRSLLDTRYKRNVLKCYKENTSFVHLSLSVSLCRTSSHSRACLSSTRCSPPHFLFATLAMRRSLRIVLGDRTQKKGEQREKTVSYSSKEDKKYWATHRWQSNRVQLRVYVYSWELFSFHRISLSDLFKYIQCQLWVAIICS